MQESQNGKRRRVPILALTADAMQEQHQKCLDAGMDGFLSKPYSLEQMRNLLTPWLLEQRDIPSTQSAMVGRR